MNKINGFAPENKDYACAIFCGTIDGCIALCNDLCITPQAYHGTFVSSSQIVVPSTYWINYELNG